MARKNKTIETGLAPLLVEKSEAARLYSSPEAVIDELIFTGCLLTRTIAGRTLVRYDRLESFAKERDPEPVHFSPLGG
jgi:hypothetical protein